MLARGMAKNGAGTRRHAGTGRVMHAGAFGLGPDYRDLRHGTRIGRCRARHAVGARFFAGGEEWGTEEMGNAVRRHQSPTLASQGWGTRPMVRTADHTGRS